MNDDVNGLIPPLASETEAQAPMTAGALLRQAREDAGLSIEDVAYRVKIHVKKLAALEENQLDQIPNAVFLRAMASSVARTLHVEPQRILELLPDSPKPVFVNIEDNIKGSFGEPTHLSAKLRTFFSASSHVIFAGLLVVAAALVYFSPHLESVWDSYFPPSAEITSTVTVVEVPLAPVALVVPAPMPETALVASAPAVVAVSSELVFKVRGSSWIEVTDAAGIVLFQRRLEAGESATVSGALPLSVIVGRADLTDVQWKEKPFTLTGVTQDNVAKFKVQ
jgi:cytoskeleton protein RodZ